MNRCYVVEYYNLITLLLIITRLRMIITNLWKIEMRSNVKDMHKMKKYRECVG